MAKAKAGTVAIEIMLEKDQFDKDFKAAQREVSAVQKQLSMELERNKVKFAVEGMDKTWVDKMFGNTVIGKIRDAKRETDFLNQQIATQASKVKQSEFAWQQLVRTKGALSGATQAAEKSFLREQMALVGLNRKISEVGSTSEMLGITLKNTAFAVAGVAAVTAAAYTSMVRSALSWGQAVNDIVDATGMSDESASKLVGTLNIVGVTAEDASGLIVKLARSIESANTAQNNARKAGKDSEDVFTRFGIAITDNSGKLLSYEEILNNIQEAHRNMRDGTEKTAMELELFGRSGAKTNDFLNLSQKQMTEYAEKMKNMGLVIKDSQKYEDLSRQLNEISLTLKGMAVTITSDSIPAIQRLLQELQGFSDWVKNNRGATGDVMDFIGVYAKNVAMEMATEARIAISAVKEFIEWRTRMKEQEERLKRDMVNSGNMGAFRLSEKTNTQTEQVKTEGPTPAEIAAAKNRKFAEQDLNNSILSMRGYVLQVALANIEKERQAWIAKTQDEVAATRWAEEAKRKEYKESQERMKSAINSVRSTFQGAYGAAISKVEEAIKTGTNSAWREAEAAVSQMKKDLEIKKEASRAVARAAGYSEESIQKGLYDPTTPEEQMRQVMEGLNDAIKAGAASITDEIRALRGDLQGLTGKGGAGGAALKFGENINQQKYDTFSADVLKKYKTFDEYTKSLLDNPQESGIYKMEITDQRQQTTNVPVTVNVNGMDAYSAEQLGQIAAQQMLPHIEAAIGNAKTQYGGQK